MFRAHKLLMCSRESNRCACPIPGEPVTTLVVRNAADEHRALSVLAGPQGHLVNNLSYVGWPICRFDSELPFDLVRCASTIDELRERAERQYCLLRYGKDDLRLMTAADKHAVKPDAWFENNSHTLVVDLSRAMNGNVAAARLRATDIANGSAAELFDEVPASDDRATEKTKTEYGKWHAAADVGKSIVNRLSPKSLHSVLLIAVAIGSIAWTCVRFHEANATHDAQLHAANLKHDLDLRTEDHAHQLALAELNQRSITDQDGRRVALTSAAKKALAREDAENFKQARLLSQMELEYPLVRFVSAQALDGVAAAMEVVPASGRVWVNGAEMNAAIARAGAKQLRKSAQARRDGGGWITEIVPSKSNGA